ncbi:MAG: DUF5915 domain-containing protein, partial [Methanopyraceae archaeon]
ERLPEGWASAEFEGGRVYLYTEMDEELRREAWAREVIRRVQEMRKELDLDLEERIEVWIDGDREVLEAVREHRDEIAREVRARELILEAPPEDCDLEREWEVEDRSIVIGLRRGA